MTTHLALLRAINLAGHKPVAMADLRDLLNGLGFTDPRSLLQSGNLVFRGGSRTGARLEGFPRGGSEEAARARDRLLRAHGAGVEGHRLR